MRMGLLFLVAMAISVAWSGDVTGQTTMPSGEGDRTDRTGRMPAPTPEMAPFSFDDDEVLPPVLLREGLTVVEAHCTMRRNDEAGTWDLLIDPEHEWIGGYEMTLLPCSRLEEMVRAAQAAPDREVVFEVTGEIFVFRRRNYLLPIHAPQLNQRAREQEAVAEPATTQQPEIEPAAERTPVAGDRARSIMRDLEQAVGPLARTVAPAGRIAEEGGRPLMQEGTLLVSRRGQIRRDRQGAWLFIFDADTNGLADPSMAILPCMMLETIDLHARRGQNTPVLLSGPVYTYRGLNYLLPTVIQVPRERTVLRP
jgi:hypothetical protein